MKVQDSPYYIAGTKLMRQMIDEYDGDGAFAIEEATLCVSKLKEYNDFWISLPANNEDGTAVMHGCRTLASRTTRYWEARLEAIRYDCARGSAVEKIIDDWRIWKHANKKDQKL